MFKSITIIMLLLTTSGVVYLWYNFTYYCLAATVTVLIIHFISEYRRSYANKKQGWKLYHNSRDSLKYEKWIDDKWESIIIEGEMQLTDKPQHTIYLPSDTQWSKFPEWAILDRANIEKRIKSHCEGDSYEITNSPM